MSSYKKLIFNPFILGIIIGLAANNLPLALVTVGLTVMLWDRREGKNFIIITTILLIIATGNINFEIIYIFILSLNWVLNNVINNNRDKFIITTFISFLSILLFPLWKYILGLIPAQLLNEFNIAGELLLLGAILLNLKRGIKKEEGRTSYILYTLLAGISITGNVIAIPCIITGLILDVYRSNMKLRIILQDEVYYLFLLILSVIFIYVNIPLSIFMVTVCVLLVVYIYLRQDKNILIETVYLSLLTGLIAGKIGLLN